MLVQFAGRPGAGKTALSRALGREIGAPVLDLDVVKTGLLAERVPVDDAARLAYSVLFGLADDLLASGLSVILDSPSRWQAIPVRSAKVAAGRGVPYVFVECRLTDRAELVRRLTVRDRSPGQNTWLGQLPPESADERAVAEWEAESTRLCGPAGDWLVVDTGRSISECLPDVLAHMNAIRAHRR